MTEQTLIQRIDSLERSNRRLKALGVVCVVGLICAVFIAAERTPQSITTDSLRLVDADGKLRAALGFDQNGTFLFLNDETGKMRASIAAQRGGTYINFKDTQDRTRAVLAFDDAGPTLRFRDEAGNTVATIAADAQGPFMQLRDESGRTRTVAPLSDIVAEPKKEGAQ